MKKDENPCPKCGKPNKAGLIKAQRQTDRNGFPIYRPDDVICACGAKLRYVLPLFRTTANGWYWEVSQ
jgi:hypothetical protein